MDLSGEGRHTAQLASPQVIVSVVSVWREAPNASRGHQAARLTHFVWQSHFLPTLGANS